MKYTVKTEETRNTLYTFRKPRYVCGKKCYSYIQFNTRSVEKNPIIVTDLQYQAFNSVLFTNKKDMFDFSIKFFMNRHDNSWHDWEFVEYKPANSKEITNINVRKVDTKYGPCYKVSSINWR